MESNFAIRFSTKIPGYCVNRQEIALETQEADNRKAKGGNED